MGQHRIVVVTMSVPTIENLNILLRYLERDYTLDDLTCRGSLLGPSRRSFIEEVIARQIYDEGRSGRLLTADFLLAGAQPSQLSFLEDRYARGLIVHSGNVFRDCRVVLQVHTAAITSQVSGLEKGLLSEVLSNHMAIWSAPAKSATPPLAAAGEQKCRSNLIMGFQPPAFCLVTWLTSL